MPYVTQSQIQTAIPGPHLVDALDDDGDQVADAGVLDNIIAKASQAVDSLLAGIYAVPFATPPSAVKEAAFIFACELIYARRERSGEANPFAKQANDWRAQLKSIGSGQKPLDANAVKTVAPGAAITEAVAVDASTR